MNIILGLHITSPPIFSTFLICPLSYTLYLLTSNFIGSFHTETLPIPWGSPHPLNCPWTFFIPFTCRFLQAVKNECLFPQFPHYKFIHHIESLSLISYIQLASNPVHLLNRVEPNRYRIQRIFTTSTVPDSNHQHPSLNHCHSVLTDLPAFTLVSLQTILHRTTKVIFKNIVQLGHICLKLFNCFFFFKKFLSILLNL